jgi:rubrerythrin
MAEEKYTCNRCGKTFEGKPDSGKDACPICGSLDSRKSSEQPVSSECGKSARFS